MTPLPPVEWRPVVTHPDRYEVSNDGRVRVKGRTITRGFIAVMLEDRVLKTTKGGRVGNYKRVMLHAPQRHAYIHHLVAEAFIGPRPEGMKVLHLDDDGEHNWVSNLRYGTTEENEMDKHVLRVVDGLEPAPF